MNLINFVYFEVNIINFQLFLARIIFGIVLVIAVAFGCVRLLEASNHMHAAKNAKISIIPDVVNNLIHFDLRKSSSYEMLTAQIDQIRDCKLLIFDAGTCS